MRERAAGALLLLSLIPTGAKAATAPAAGEKVTLAAAVQRALDRNPTVTVAVEEIRRADALVTQARAGWMPLLTGNGAFTRLDHDRVNTQTNTMTGVTTRTRIAAANQVAGNLQLTVPLVAAPAWTATSRAKSQLRIAEASAADVRRLVAQTTARAYITVVAQHRLVAASETARETAKAHYDYAHTRLAGGIGRAIDEVRAQQDLAAVDVQVQSTYVALARAREALGVLLGGAGPVDSVDEVDLGGLPTLTGALASAQERPDVKVLQQRVLAAQQLKKDIWATYAPLVSAVGQPFFQEPPTILLPRTGWQIQLVLSLPIYDGGLRSGLSEERGALLGEARANLEGGLRQAQSDVRVSFEAMLRADQALAASRDATRLAHRAYELATLAYRAGASTNIEVLDAARQARDADTAVAQAEDQSRQSRLDLLVAAGKFP